MGATRRFSDPGRGCDERARTAAAFIALAVDPPSFSPRPPSFAPRPPSFGPPHRLSAPHVSLEAGAMIDGAPGAASQGSVVSYGASLRASLEWRYLGVVVGVAGLSPTTLSQQSVQVRLTRVPFDLALRALLRRGRLELLGDLGVSLAILLVEGEAGAGTPLSGSRLDAGLRAGVGLRVFIGRYVAPFAMIQGTVLPRPYDLTVELRGNVGHTPIGWLGAVVGVAARPR
jgi:hypothetical protein